MNDKKKTPLVLWIALVIISAGAVLSLNEAFGWRLLESKKSKCNSYASDMAEKNLQTELNILKDKNNPSETDLNNIELYEDTLKNKAVLREDSEYYFNKCME